jgi:hypothetical protein
MKKQEYKMSRRLLAVVILPMLNATLGLAAPTVPTSVVMPPSSELKATITADEIIVGDKTVDIVLIRNPHVVTSQPYNGNSVFRVDPKARMRADIMNYEQPEQTESATRLCASFGFNYGAASATLYTAYASEVVTLSPKGQVQMPSLLRGGLEQGPSGWASGFRDITCKKSK